LFFLIWYLSADYKLGFDTLFSELVPARRTRGQLAHSLCELIFEKTEPPFAKTRNVAAPAWPEGRSLPQTLTRTFVSSFSNEKTQKF